jgi:hypothetical protein
MNDRIKIISSITMLVILGLAGAPNADAGTVSAQRGTSLPIQTCIAEIGKIVDYGNASRVVHTVTSLDQKNLVELEIRIETSVYLKSDDDVATGYTASCITGALGRVVSIRFV